MFICSQHVFRYGSRQHGSGYPELQYEAYEIELAGAVVYGDDDDDDDDDADEDGELSILGG